jgi:hypothetical protein
MCNFKYTEYASTTGNAYMVQSVSGSKLMLRPRYNTIHLSAKYTWSSTYECSMYKHPYLQMV